MKFEYCPECGEKLLPHEIGDEGEVPFCEKCERPFFPFSYPCVICLCLDENDNVILIRQSYGHTRYVCVAGYIKSGESAEDAVRREISEEIGLEADAMRFMYSKYYEKHDNLMLAFAVRVKGTEFSLSSEVSSADRFTMDEAEQLLTEGSYGLDMLRMLRRNECKI